ncbi:656_t:CDS:2 [Cetraspora pellucida]|uniref:656_t:CDS:1 n=1 Tax=Cetraspora pellucida TaxID=1433469 RepID=A0A9N8W9K8_9GLOM|nr:656_t:CDS:2 [Cetraspora pellucida]
MNNCKDAVHLERVINEIFITGSIVVLVPPNLLHPILSAESSPSILPAESFLSTLFLALSIKAPFDQTKWVGGQTENITWEEDNKAPLLKDMGMMGIDLMYNTSNFCKVITLATSIDPKSLLFACPLPTTIGLGSDPTQYTGTNSTNSTSTNNTYTAYSHTFTINNITGTLQCIPNNPSSTTANTANTTTTIPSDSTKVGNNVIAGSSAPAAPVDSNKPAAASGSSTAKSAATAGASNSKTSNANSLVVYPSFVGLSLAIISFALSHL